MNKFSSIIALFFLIGFIGTPVSAQTETAVQKSFTDVVYKTINDNENLKLDVFLPNNQVPEKGYPVLMFITGGAWVEGDKTMETPYFRKKLKETLLETGFAVVSINYRLLNETTHFPSPIEDCKDAVRWIRANAQKYGFDIDNIGLLGESAGGHLAMMTAYSDSDLWPGEESLSKYPIEVKYVVDYYGPTDLNLLFQTGIGGFKTFLAKIFMNETFNLRNRVIAQMTNDDFKKNKKAIIKELKSYSPVDYVNKNTVPTFIAHGNKDKLVPYKQSVELKKALDAKGVENHLMTVNKAGHVFVNIPDEEVDKVVEASVEFMKKHLR